MKCILVYSGGLDSTVLLHHLLNEGHQVKCISFNYGQKQIKEINYANAMCDTLGVEHRLINLDVLQPIFSTSSLTNDACEVANGPYEEQIMYTTVVPNRNMIFLSITAAWTLSLKWDSIAYACHNGDHTVYPDCRPEFVDALDKALQIADWNNIQLLAPFVNNTKTDIIKLGSKLNVPFENTWSCYKGLDLHCGQCPTCIERQRSFLEAEIEDPTVYEVPYNLKTLQIS